MGEMRSTHLLSYPLANAGTSPALQGQFGAAVPPPPVSPKSPWAPWRHRHHPGATYFDCAQISLIMAATR